MTLKSTMENYTTDQNIGFIIGDVSRLLRYVFDQRVAGIGLTRAQWRVLVHLQRLDGPTQSELADALEIGNPSLGKMLDTLEQKGWIVRQAAPLDRRAKHVYCTEKVQPIMDVMSRIGAELTDAAMRGLPPEERQNLLSVLSQVKANLLALDSEAPVKSIEPKLASTTTDAEPRVLSLAEAKIDGG